jgi:hypothetical protein
MEPGYYLYYAGMANDPTANEQIGLAVSKDGVRFDRWNETGLLIPRDEQSSWKNLRTCNPTVLSWKGRHLLLYQGVHCPNGTHGAQTGLITSIGSASSDDGEHFELAPDPILTHEHMAAIDPRQNPAETIGLIEPAALVDGDRLRLWFVYNHSTFPGNGLFHCESTDGRTWRIDPAPTLRGSAFGDFNLHYPHVLRTTTGFDLWFMLRNNANQQDGIFKATSKDGLTWDASSVKQILPAPAGSGVRLPGKRLEPPQLRVPNTNPLPLRVGKRAVNLLASGVLWKLLFPGRDELRAGYGYAHPHVVDTPQGRRLYFHYANSRRGTKWLDIGLAELDDQDRPRNLRVVLTVPQASTAWDARFVADPFVVVEG